MDSLRSLLVHCRGFLLFILEMFSALTAARMVTPMVRLASPAMARFAAPLAACRSFGTLIGKQAPAFAAQACMPDNTLRTVNSSDYKGK